ncbi:MULTISPECIES: GNAT family N-acetyltransferase [Paenibacillus]|jgi:L-amino acid N-acyltransferase YncA|uniref:GNAT family N-acetyltransferase n=1 Tax=Paenibacillus baimaensis TaxID=2982185 RepID=A0ABT2UJB8_9BACL|nr:MULTISPECIES: GNAT family N-acetyltransferase [unclassified Paenibacillus]MCU6794707.1 GNAT family N-acetyltransferase [Paenibacillus sp. WQ 127069]OMF19538.1 GNAT family N-acetyltransferase [Paenibacillus sp. FSL H7-0331]
MQELIFTPIAEEHLQEIMEIYNHFVANTTVSFHTELQTLDQMRAAVVHSNPRFRSFAILEDQLVKGYVLITQHKSKQAYDITGEVTIYLNPAFVGQGIGSKALYFIEEIARTERFHSLVATICSENVSSAGLFNKHGYTQAAYFKEVGIKFDRKLDIVVLQKMLNL